MRIIGSLWTLKKGFRKNEKTLVIEGQRIERVQPFGF